MVFQNLIDPNASVEARQRGESMLSDRTASLQDVAVEPTLLESDDVVTVLVEESVNHGLTIIGATREGLIQEFVFGTIPETVAEHAPTTAIMIKRSLDVRTRLQDPLDKLRERVTGSPNAMEQEGTGGDDRD